MPAMLRISLPVQAASVKKYNVLETAKVSVDFNGEPFEIRASYP